MGGKSAGCNCAMCGQDMNLAERLIGYKQGDQHVCNACRDVACRGVGVVPFENVSVAKLVIKLLFGVAFLATISSDETIEGAIISLAIGLGLVAWAIVPLWLEKSRCDSIVAQKLSAQHTRSMARRVCPSCGGVSTGPYCEYCGRPFTAND